MTHQIYLLYQAFVFWLESSKYTLLFLGAFFEGPVVMLGAGFLYHEGQFYFLPMYLLLVGGDFAADIVWYLVGYYGGTPLVAKYGSFFNITPEIVAKIEKRFRAYQSTILIISKLTMGFGFSLATLITAGLMRISLKRFIVINLLGGLIWTLFMVTMGYFFGNIYALIPRTYKILFVVLGLIVVILVLRFVNRYLTSIESDTL